MTTKPLKFRTIRYLDVQFDIPEEHRSALIQAHDGSNGGFDTFYRGESSNFPEPTRRALAWLFSQFPDKVLEVTIKIWW